MLKACLEICENNFFNVFLLLLLWEHIRMLCHMHLMLIMKKKIFFFLMCYWLLKYSLMLIFDELDRYLLLFFKQQKKFLGMNIYAIKAINKSLK